MLVIFEVVEDEPLAGACVTCVLPPNLANVALMKEAKISEVKNQLSRYLALVRRGEVVRILDRDVPVAQIVPIAQGVPGRAAGREALLEMERKGLVRRGSGQVDREILDADPPGKPSGVLAALLEDRDSR